MAGLILTTISEMAQFRLSLAQFAATLLEGRPAVLSSTIRRAQLTLYRNKK